MDEPEIKSVRELTQEEVEREPLFLIAHKVRGKVAFDVAIQMAVEGYDEPWWIIPTSGHRAYPFWNGSFEELGVHQLPDGNWAWGPSENGYRGLIGTIHEGLRDHYEAAFAQIRESPKKVSGPLVNIDFSDLKF